MESILANAPGKVQKWATPRNYLGYKSVSLTVPGEQGNTVTGYLYKRSNKQVMLATVFGRWHLRCLQIDKRTRTLTISGIGNKRHK